MTGPDPGEFGWWLASRAAGVVALLCIAASVGIGLAMAGRVSRRPALARTLMSVHQQTALVGLVAIAVHGITLLGDRFLSPSFGDLLLPFTSTYEPVWTGLGVTAWWLAMILGLSFWVRHRIGVRLWRTLHRATILVYVLSVAHVLGAGTDAAEPWMRALLLATGAPILFLFLMRLMTPRTGPAFRRFRVTRVLPETASVRSFELAPADRKPMPPYAPGQFVSLRAKLAGGDRATRSYSLSAAPRPDRCRISVKREAGGRVSEHLHTAVAVGDVLELSEPAGAFALGAEPAERPLVLLSAGIGLTPLLAMLEALAADRSSREVWWLHTARNGAEHAFRAEARAHLAWLPNGSSHVRYTRPDPADRLGRDHDATGRLTAAEIRAIGVPLDAEWRLCGPAGFVGDLTAQLTELGVAPERLRSESFGGGAPAPAPTDAAPATVAFTRSGVTAEWRPDRGSLLDLAERSAVGVPSSCRVGACHSCRVGVVRGAVRHAPEPAAPPPPGCALLCCAVPQGDVELDA